jgi:hypothetical protein
MSNMYRNSVVRSWRPTDTVTRDAFKAAGITIIEPDDNEFDGEFHGRDWHVVYAEDIGDIFRQFGADTTGFRFWFVRPGGMAWFMDFAGTGAHTAPEVGWAPVVPVEDRR